MRQQEQAGQPPGDIDFVALLEQLRGWARELGFSQIGVADIDLTDAAPGLRAWLDAGCHGSMDWMAAHGSLRWRPAALVPGTLRIVTARMDYLPRDAPADWAAREGAALADPQRAVVSVYARGRDYHRVLRPRLQQLAYRLAAVAGPHGHRAFTDSAPVMEVALATRSGLGWRGKHTLALTREAGSTYFLGELFTTLPLPLTPPDSAHCGRCTACMAACPTGAIVAPYRLDARLCISYLTIEHDGPIPEPLRVAVGNRLYGCDDCQLACPWNRHAARSPLPDFDERHGLGAARLAELLRWDEADFLTRTAGSAIRRIGYRRWRRNLAVVAGNALRALGMAEAVGAPSAANTGDVGGGRDPGELRAQVQAARHGPDAADALLAEHWDWALAQRGLSAAPPVLPGPAAARPSPAASTG